MEIKVEDVISFVLLLFLLVMAAWGIVDVFIGDINGPSVNDLSVISDHNCITLSLVGDGGKERTFCEVKVEETKRIVE